MRRSFRRCCESPMLRPSASTSFATRAETPTVKVNRASMSSANRSAKGSKRLVRGFRCHLDVESFVASRRQVRDHFRGRVAAPSVGEELLDLRQSDTRGQNRGLDVVAAPLTEPHGGQQSIAHALAPASLLEASVLAHVIVNGLRGAAVAERAILASIGFAQVTEVAPAHARVVDLRLGQGALELQDLEWKARRRGQRIGGDAPFTRAHTIEHERPQRGIHA